MRCVSLQDFKVVIECPAPYGDRVFRPKRPGNPLLMEDVRSLQEAEKTLEQVLRHVDTNKFQATVEPTRIETCAFCGKPWTEKEEDYNGGCCKEDEKNNPSPA